MNLGTHGGADARKKSRVNPAATDSDKPGGEGRREEGGSRLIVPRRSYLKVFFPLYLSPLFNFQKICFMRALVPGMSQSLRGSSKNNQSAEPESAWWACPQVRLLSCWTSVLHDLKARRFLLRVLLFSFLKKILTKKKLRLSCFCFYFSNFVALWYLRTKVFYNALHFCNSSYVQQHPRTLI